MLQHDENLQEDVPAAQVRVTAEEFARAVSRHQARREEAAQHLEGTVTLGEAVRELGLEATPEELLREVREAREARAQQGGRKPLRVRRGFVWAGGGTLALLFVGLSLSQMPPGPVQNVSPPPMVSTVAPGATPATIKAPSATIVQDGNGPIHILRTLGKVSDGVPVHANLSATSDGVSLANYSSSSTTWTLIKYGSQIYIRGWMAAMSSDAMQIGPIQIYNRAASTIDGVTPQKVTLRVDRLHCIPDQSSDEMLTVQNVTADNHFHELWR